MSSNSINVTVRPKNSVAISRVGQPKSTVLINQAGVVAAKRLGDLIDVDTSAKTDGSLIIYDANQDKFLASTLLEKQQINGGNF